MKWYGITGSWRVTSRQVESDVRATVRDIISQENGIVTGGALNVDWFAVDEAMKLNETCDQIKICLPVEFETYIKHYHMRALEGVISDSQADQLERQLRDIWRINRDSIIDRVGEKIVDRESYFEMCIRDSSTCVGK